MLKAQKINETRTPTVIPTNIPVFVFFVSIWPFMLTFVVWSVAVLLLSQYVEPNSIVYARVEIEKT